MEHPVYHASRIDWMTGLWNISVVMSVIRAGLEECRTFLSTCECYGRDDKYADHPVYHASGKGWMRGMWIILVNM